MGPNKVTFCHHLSPCCSPFSTMTLTRPPRHRRCPRCPHCKKRRVCNDCEHRRFPSPVRFVRKLASFLHAPNRTRLTDTCCPTHGPRTAFTPLARRTHASPQDPTTRRTTSRKGYNYRWCPIVNVRCCAGSLRSTGRNGSMRT